MIKITRKFASLEILVDGEKREVTFPVDKMEDYRAVVEVLKAFKNAGTESEDEMEQLDAFISVMEGFRDTIRQAVGEEQYAKVFGELGEDVPMLSWVAILQAMNEEYAKYLSSAMSTEGEL
jgi:hypothetical protein